MGSLPADAPVTLRYSFLAHEPALGHRGGSEVASGGAGYAAAEQAERANRFLRARSGGAPTAEVALLCPRSPTRRAPPRGVRVVEFEAPAGSVDDLARRFAGDRAWLARFADLLGDGAVLAHHLAAARVVEALGLPSICALHSLWPTVRSAVTGAPPGARAEACASLLASAAAVVVATRAEREVLLATAPPAARARDLARRVRVVPHGVSPFLARLATRDGLGRRRAAWRRRLVPGAAPDDVVFYVVARLVPYKRVLEAIEAFARVAGRLPRSRLLVVGPPTDAAYAERCRSRVRDVPADVRARVVVVGPQRLEAAPVAGDVLVHLSRVESWSRAVDEAFVLGRPAVLAASPFLAEKAGCPWPPVPASRSLARTGDDRALWIDGDDPAALDAALLRAGTDAAWRAACGEANRRRAAALAWDGPVRALLGLWDEVEHAARGRRPFALEPVAADEGRPRCAST